MKKIFLSIALLGGIVFTSQAQTDKGQFIVRGNVHYSTSKSDADNARASHRFSIVPNLGYFVDNHIAVGTGIRYQSATSSTPGNFDKSEAFVLSPFGRY